MNRTVRQKVFDLLLAARVADDNGRKGIMFLSPIGWKRVKILPGGWVPNGVIADKDIIGHLCGLRRLRDMKEKRFFAYTSDEFELYDIEKRQATRGTFYYRLKKRNVEMQLEMGMRGIG